MSKSKKELRREAMIRERERRARSSELRNFSNAESVDWGTAQFLDESIRRNILRIGGAPTSPGSQDAVVVLSQEIVWPLGSFDSSENRYRSVKGVEMADLEIQDSVWPWCRGFQFCNKGEFYTGWQNDFVGCTSAYVPIGADGHYYYFISQNETDTNDPLVYRVDHETVDQPPYNKNDVTFGFFVELLVAT